MNESGELSSGWFPVQHTEGEPWKRVHVLAHDIGIHGAGTAERRWDHFIEVLLLLGHREIERVSTSFGVLRVDRKLGARGACLLGKIATPVVPPKKGWVAELSALASLQVTDARDKLVWTGAGAQAPGQSLVLPNQKELEVAGVLHLSLQMPRD